MYRNRVNNTQTIGTYICVVLVYKMLIYIYI